MSDELGTLLFVDDQPKSVNEYVVALRQAGFQVRLIGDADAAFDFAYSKPGTPEDNEALPVTLIVLDIMMPPGKRYANVDTEEGMLTGAYLYDDIATCFPEAGLIVLTNSTHREVLVKFPDKIRMRFMSKVENTQYDVAECAVAIANMPIWMSEVERTLEAWTEPLWANKSDEERAYSLQNLTHEVLSLLAKLANRNTPAPEVRKISDREIMVTWTGDAQCWRITFSELDRLDVRISENEKSVYGFAGKVSEKVIHDLLERIVDLQ